MATFVLIAVSLAFVVGLAGMMRPLFRNFSPTFPSPQESDQSSERKTWGAVGQQQSASFSAAKSDSQPNLSSRDR